MDPTVPFEEYEALQSGAALVDRSARGRLWLTGADRRSYLQGLLTNDIEALTPGTGCYAALLTAQGRMTSDMRVSELGDRLLIDLPGATAVAVRERLADFVFSEDVEVHDAGGTLGQLGLYGPRAAELLASVLADAAEPSAEDRLRSMAVDANASWAFSGDVLIAIRSDDFGPLGFDLFISAGRVAELAAALRDRGAREITEATADVARVERGRPKFGVDMDEHTIPLEAGIEDRAISLTKGCYVGQEVIIRVLHRGHGRVAKRLVGLVAGAGERVDRGERLYDAAGKEVGVVTSAAISPRLGHVIALGYVHRDYTGPGHALRVATPEGPRGVTVVDLPFTRRAAG